MDSEEKYFKLYFEKPRRRADLGREVSTLQDLSDRYSLQQPSPVKCHHRLSNYAAASCSKFSPLKFITTLIPILHWLPKYSVRHDLLNDLVAGFTVAVMHIPQGMAYGLLAGVDPVVGIYTAFFPVLVYVLLGTMPHVSMGSFAVVSILVSKTVSEWGVDPPATGDIPEGQYSKIQVLAAVTFCIGLIQLLAGMCRLGFMSVLLTDTLVSAFTVGASLHVLTSQIKHILGLSIARQTGAGKLVLTYVELGQSVKSTNLVTLAISLTVIGASLIADRIIGPKLKTKCRFPLPTQLALIIVFTTLSEFLGFQQNYHVRTISDIGDIPVGLPSAVYPTIELIPKVFVDCIVPGVVSFVVGLGLGKMFGQKHGYEIDSNQELIAQGASNLVGSLFSCIPMAGSLSRSVVQEASGCRTLLTSLTSALLLLSVMLYLGPFFLPLPVSVLAAIIIASLYSIFLKISDVGKYWEVNVYEGCIWLITFCATVFIDVDYGLIIGVIATLVLTVVQGMSPGVRVLEQTLAEEDSAVWLDNQLFKTRAGGTKVVQISGPLHFMVLDSVRSRLSKELGAGPGNQYKMSGGGGGGGVDLILDLSGVSYLDYSAAGLVKWLEGALKREEGRLGLVATPRQVETLDTELEPFPTYIDALAILSGNSASPNISV